MAAESVERNEKIKLLTPTVFLFFIHETNAYINITKSQEKFCITYTLLRSQLPLEKEDFCSRMSPDESLKHVWLDKAGELQLSKTNLKKYVIKKRWIKAVNTIIALRRMGAKLDF